uniref:30S ribosomal protein S2 n=1 Tax=Biomphalaria glabrata TaxID=6526 RepID=A0A2C9KNZ5_BIOGL
MRELFDASVHMGHKTMFWNPLMEPYIYGKTNTVHIIDLKQSFVLLHNALNVVYNCVLKGGNILFVSTKNQAAEIVKEEAKRCGQYYIAKRWLGGLFTNWVTIVSTIKNIEKKSNMINNPDIKIIKKERMCIERNLKKLEQYFGGIHDMNRLPDMIFVIDAVKERIAITEANKLGIPVIAILDTNADPRGVDYPIPGNDDSVRSIKLYCRLFADTIIRAISDSFADKKDKNESVAEEEKIVKKPNNIGHIKKIIREE